MASSTRKTLPYVSPYTRGTALRDDELVAGLKRADGSFRVAKRVIIHTDSAKAYKKLGPLSYTGAGALHSPFETSAVFRELEILHTNVTHKRSL